MSVKIRLNRVFQSYSNNIESVEVEGNTVKECLDNLINLFPGLKDILFDTQNVLSAVVAFNDGIVSPNELDRAVTEHDEILLLPMLYGG